MPLAKLISALGMKKGVKRRGPSSFTVIAAASIPGNPPIPDPIKPPYESGLDNFSGFQFASSKACFAAAIA